MRIVYMGTPEFACPPLAALCEAGYEVVTVISQPDRRRNRGQLLPTPVKTLALERQLPVWTPERINDPESIQQLQALAPDLLVVVAYGQLLSAPVLALPRLGAVNIHASLLPAYRGAAPIHRAILAGQRESGVSLMYLDQGMDSGDVIASVPTPIGEDETSGQLYERMARLGTELLLAELPKIAQGTAARQPQQHELASYAPMLKKEEERLAWEKPAQVLHNQIRAFSPAPGAYGIYQGKRLKIWQSAVDLFPAAGCAPGEVAEISKEAIWVCCGSGVLRLITVQPEGKSRMAAGDFARGYGVKKGSRLE